MAKATESTEPVVVNALASTFAIPLDEFCQRLSAKKMSPEIISGFHHAQKKAGKLQGSDSDYLAAFAAFLKQPA